MPERAAQFVVASPTAIVWMVRAWTSTGAHYPGSFIQCTHRATTSRIGASSGASRLDAVVGRFRRILPPPSSSAAVRPTRRAADDHYHRAGVRTRHRWTPSRPHRRITSRRRVCDVCAAPARRGRARAPREHAPAGDDPTSGPLHHHGPRVIGVVASGRSTTARGLHAVKERRESPSCRIRPTRVLENAVARKGERRHRLLCQMMASRTALHSSSPAPRPRRHAVPLETREGRGADGASELDEGAVAGGIGLTCPSAAARSRSREGGPPLRCRVGHATHQTMLRSRGKHERAPGARRRSKSVGIFGSWSRRRMRGRAVAANRRTIRSHSPVRARSSGAMARAGARTSKRGRGETVALASLAAGYNLQRTQ